MINFKCSGKGSLTGSVFACFVMMSPMFSFEVVDITGVLFALIPSLINLGLFFYILFRLPRNRVINVFCLLTFCMFLWQLNDAIARVATSETMADKWNCIFSASWIFIGPLCLHFALLYTQTAREDHLRVWGFIVYVPAFLFMGIFNSSVFPHRMVHDPFWGWVDNHDVYLLDKVIVYWISVLVISATVLLFVYAHKVRKRPLLHYQSFLIALGIAIPTAAGLITQVTFPIFLHRPSIPVTSTFMTFFSISTVIALKKYRLFSVSELMSNERLMESLPVPVLNISIDKRINFINEAGMRLLAASKQAIAKHKGFEEILQFPHARDRQKFQRIWERTMSGEDCLASECSLSSPAGTIQVLISARPILNNNNIEGALIILRDITELKESYRTLEESEKMLRKSQQIARLGSWHWDLSTNNVLWSDELYRLYGLSPGEELINIEKFIALVHPEDKERTTSIVENALRTKEPFDFCYRIIRKDGSERIIRGFGEAEVDRDGTLIAMKGTAQDVTEEKQHEAMLHMQNMELQKINSELDKFVYSVSHDLRSPLTSMLGLINIIEEDVPDEGTKAKIGMLQDCVTKLDKFIMDILDYSRNARTDINPSLVDVSAIVKEITAHLQFLHSTKVRLTVVVNQDVPLYSDYTRLFIILNNLISNAYNYIDTGKDQATIGISVLTDTSSCTIEVGDNGIGISEEYQAKIFDMFFRGTNISKGSGLGLYIVKSSVEKLGGSIALRSQPGIGSVFTVTVPNLLHSGKAIQHQAAANSI